MTSTLRPLASGLVALALSLGLLGCGVERDPPLQFASALLPDASLGLPYQAVLAVANARTPLASVEVVAGALPPGLTVEILLPLDTKELRVIGTPTAAGTASFTLRVACFGTNHPGQVGEQAFSLRVSP